MKDTLPQCAKCTIDSTKRLCIDEDGISPGFCPTKDKVQIQNKALAAYANQENREFYRQSSWRGKERHPRIVEMIDFAKRMAYRRLGLAFCIGLSKEAAVVEDIFRKNGFEMVSVICKAGRITQELVGLSVDETTKHKRRTWCNPIMQAMVLNEAKTEFNIVLGLCVGHESLFFKYSDAMCSVLAAKDKELGHNPLAAVYTIHSYYANLME